MSLYFVQPLSSLRAIHVTLSNMRHAYHIDCEGLGSAGWWGYRGGQVVK